jgi:hypothetical protein
MAIRVLRMLFYLIAITIPRFRNLCVDNDICRFLFRSVESLFDKKRVVNIPGYGGLPVSDRF